jgi:hypothetical protein
MLLSKNSAQAPSIRNFYVSLLKTSAVAWPLAVGMAMPARAADECGAAVAGAASCTSLGNPYAAGITYTAAGDIAVTTAADVAAINTVRVTGTGVTTINNAATLSTTLANQPGIVASGASASVNSTGPVSTVGAAGGVGVDGITVTGTTGSAAATVRTIAVTGPISGVSRPRALVVTAATGASATINGAVSATSGDAVVITGATTIATVASGGSVTGGVNGVVLTGRSSVAGTTGVSLTNAGTITGGSAGAAVTITAGALAIPGSGLGTVVNSGVIGNGDNLAILINRGLSVINNSGTINGSIRTAFENDVVNNSGTFNAFRNSDFGDGVDIFNNIGTLNILPAGSTTSAAVFTDLEVFNNSGMINFVNGAAFNSLTLPGSFAGAGTSSRRRPGCRPVERPVDREWRGNGINLHRAGRGQSRQRQREFGPRPRHGRRRVGGDRVQHCGAIPEHRVHQLYHRAEYGSWNHGLLIGRHPR